MNSLKRFVQQSPALGQKAQAKKDCIRAIELTRPLLKQNPEMTRKLEELRKMLG